MLERPRFALFHIFYVMLFRAREILYLVQSKHIYSFKYSDVKVIFSLFFTKSQSLPLLSTTLLRSVRPNVLTYKNDLI